MQTFTRKNLELSQLMKLVTSLDGAALKSTQDKKLFMFTVPSSVTTIFHKFSAQLLTPELTKGAQQYLDLR